mgnify:CR=1 FL=1
MTYIDSIYNKYENLFITPCFCKSRVDSEFLIIMNNNLETFYFTDTAKEMIKNISSGIKVNELLNIIIQEYEVDLEDLKSDIINFLKDMQWKGIMSLSCLEN